MEYKPVLDMAHLDETGHPFVEICPHCGRKFAIKFKLHERHCSKPKLYPTDKTEKSPQASTR